MFDFLEFTLQFAAVGLIFSSLNHLKPNENILYIFFLNNLTSSSLTNTTLQTKDGRVQTKGKHRVPHFGRAVICSILKKKNSYYTSICSQHHVEDKLKSI